MKVVILCGGESLRFKNAHFEESKVMAKIGEKPILWHIMQNYISFGFKDFILCTKDSDSEIATYFKKAENSKNITIEIIKTGEHTPTGGRVKLIEPLIKEDHFFVTYGDGLSNINISKLLDFHLEHKKIATLSAVKPRSQFGILKIEENNTVSEFLEKPKMLDWINAGFFVFSKTIFPYLELDQPMETSLFNKLPDLGELKAFKHHGFWKSMDTFKEKLEINEMCKNNKAPWKNF
jgi:glucose-1-phosphate cytidylyltransferase